MRSVLVMWLVAGSRRIDIKVIVVVGSGRLEGVLVQDRAFQIE